MMPRIDFATRVCPLCDRPTYEGEFEFVCEDCRVVWDEEGRPAVLGEVCLLCELGAGHTGDHLQVIAW